MRVRYGRKKGSNPDKERGDPRAALARAARLVARQEVVELAVIGRVYGARHHALPRLQHGHAAKCIHGRGVREQRSWSCPSAVRRCVTAAGTVNAQAH
jgi:hypothetical protein